MRPKVKICGLTRPEDARAATRLGADYLGTIFFTGSPRCVKEDILEELLFFMPDGRRVMVDVMPDCESLARRMDLGFDYCQIHFDIDTPEEQLGEWMDTVGRSRLWLAPRIQPGQSIPEHILAYADTFLLDGFSKNSFGGTGKNADWASFANTRKAHLNKHFCLAGGLKPDNVLEALVASGAEQIDLNSGVESAPGIKDAAKISAVMQILRGMEE